MLVVLQRKSYENEMFRLDRGSSYLGCGCDLRVRLKGARNSHTRGGVCHNVRFRFTLPCLENSTNCLEHRLFRRTDVTRRHDSVLEFNEKHPMMTNNKKKKKKAESKSDSTGEVEPSDLLDF